MPSRPTFPSANSPQDEQSLVAQGFTPQEPHYNQHTQEMVQFILDGNILFSNNNSDTQIMVLVAYITNYFNHHRLTLPILHKIALALTPYIQQAKKLDGSEYYQLQRERAHNILMTALYNSWLNLFPRLLTPYIADGSDSTEGNAPSASVSTPPPPHGAAAESELNPPSLTL